MGIKISDLPEASSIGSGDYLHILQGGLGKKVTALETLWTKPEAFAKAKAAEHSAEKAREACKQIKEVEERYEMHKREPLMIVKEVRRELNKLQQEINQLSKKGIEANVTANVTEINTTITLAEQKLLQNATSEGISLINQAKVAIDKLEDFLDNLEEKREHMA